MPPLTLFHVVLSLIGIGSGLVVLFGMLKANPLNGWTAVFLATTAATSLTGFLLPAPHFLPSHAIGILSLIVLAIATAARYSRHLAGGWRATYVITALIALYFNVFVLIVQLFRKVPSLEALAPTQSEPPFLVTQLIVLVGFVILTVAAVQRFKAVGLRQTRAA